ncbi:MAG: xanthine dehydrogenase small subunit [Proteobacteria bacterium]|nr:xanthine dehydrogenase small subunit [Pseudomonadota bacterium]
MNRIQCTINDRTYDIEGLPPTMSLLHYLRDIIHLTGTKEGCNEGDCGTCTVILKDSDSQPPRYRAINACLILLPMLHGKQIYTIEALAQSGKRHPVQAAILQRHASQCGYCTPGVAMSLFEATYRHDLREPWQYIEQMSGNLCRCTGYRPIFECVRTLAGTGHDDAFTHKLTEPPLAVQTLDYRYENTRFFVPNTLEEALEFKSAYPDATIVSGASDVAVIINKHGGQSTLYMSLSNIQALRHLSADDTSLHIGATTRLADIESFVQERCTPLGRILRFFASHQTKQVACMSGSVSSASPVGDIAPVLVALNATVTLGSLRGTRQLRLEDFFVGYRKTCIQSDEIVLGFDIPNIPQNARCAAYKVSKRLELDISSVSACCYVETDEAGIVTAARLAYGGVSALPGARAKLAEAALLGKPWNEDTIEHAAQMVAQDFSPISDVRASAWYRKEVACNLLRGFYYETLEENLPKRDYRPTSTVQLGNAL